MDEQGCLAYDPRFGRDVEGSGSTISASVKKENLASQNSGVDGFLERCCVVGYTTASRTVASSAQEVRDG